MHIPGHINLKRDLKSLYLSLIIIQFLNMGCDNNFKNFNDDKSPNISLTYILPQKTIDSLIYLSVAMNDTFAYSKLSNYFFSNDIEDRFFPTAFQMANKNNYGNAYYDQYSILTCRYSDILDYSQLDEKTRFYALYTLLKSRELGYSWAQNDIDEIYKNQKIPSSSLLFQEYIDSIKR